MKKVTENETLTSHERYLYRGYLQLAVLDMLNGRKVLRTLLWDPLEEVATRPLALVQDDALYCYGIDFSKNVTEVFDEQGAVAAAYGYSPYGQVAFTGSAGAAAEAIKPPWKTLPWKGPRPSLNRPRHPWDCWEWPP